MSHDDEQEEIYPTHRPDHHFETGLGSSSNTLFDSKAKIEFSRNLKDIKRSESFISFVVSHPIEEGFEKNRTFFEMAAEMSVEGEEQQTKKRTFKEFFAKYFIEGQKYRTKPTDFDIIEKDPKDLVIFRRHRKLFCFLIPFFLCQFFWWCLALKYDYLELFKTIWQLPAVLILGSTLAGMTGQGSGAVAYPITTFVLHLSPVTGRDLSIGLQTVGMACGTLSVLLNGGRIQWRAIGYQSIGAIPAVILAFEFLEKAVSPSVKKMIFVSLWSAFAIALYLLNTEKKRITVTRMQNFTRLKAVALIISGFLGGIFTALTGSGVDICTFAILTFLFRLPENLAAPSGIAMMAMISPFSVFWRASMLGEFDAVALDYLKVCIPSVSLFVPFGSFLGSHFHRITIAFMVGIMEMLAMAGFLATLPSLSLLACSLSIILAGFIIFNLLGRLGNQILQEEIEALKEVKKEPLIIVQ